jgi:hypothetical protein
MLAPPPGEPLGWWTERRMAREAAELDRWVAERAAEVRAAAERERASLPGALVARAGRYLRAVDAALGSWPCDCVREGYRNGCIRCHPDLRSTGPAAGHGVEARWAGELERRGGGRVLDVR